MRQFMPTLPSFITVSSPVGGGAMLNAQRGPDPHLSLLVKYSMIESYFLRARPQSARYALKKLPCYWNRSTGATHACAHAHMHRNARRHRDTHSHTPTHTNAHRHRDTHSHTHASTHARTHPQTHTDTETHSHTHTHAHARTHTHKRRAGTAMDFSTLADALRAPL